MKRDNALIAVALGGTALLLAQLLDFGYGRDQGIYALVARTIREGGAPYRDAWDFKPPGIFLIYAAAGRLSGAAVWGIRAIEAAALVSLVAAFGLLSRHYLGDARPGLAGGALAVLTHVQLEFWHTAQPESFGAVLVAWGILACAKAMQQGIPAGRSATLWWVGGTCYGLAAVLKPTIGIAGAASLGAGLVATLRRGPAAWRPAAAAASSFAGGVLMAAILGLVLFVVRGGFPDLVETLLVFTPRYTSVAWAQTSAPRLLWQLLSDWLFGYSALIPAGLALLLAFKPSGGAREGAVHVGACIAALLIGVFAQGRLFAYHFGTVLPLTALLAGWGLWRCWIEVRARWTGALAFAALVAVLMAAQSATLDVADGFARRCWLRARAWAEPDARPFIRNRLYSTNDYRALDNRLAAEWIARETPANRAVFVYGFTPELYLASGRRTASRYIYNVPQRARWSRAAARRELLADLARSRPVAILVEHGDYMPTVTGSDFDSAADVRDFAALWTLLQHEYRPSGRIGKFDVYRAN